jgi:hypothetical protein
MPARIVIPARITMPVRIVMPARITMPAHIVMPGLVPGISSVTRPRWMVVEDQSGQRRARLALATCHRQQNQAGYFAALRINHVLVYQIIGASGMGHIPSRRWNPMRRSQRRDQPPRDARKQGERR